MSAPAIILWDKAYNRSGDDKLPRAVVNVLRTYMDNDTLEGWVKRETLMRGTGLSERQVDRHIAANVKAGWLAITSRGHSGGKSNDYRLTYPKPGVSVTQTQTDLSMQTDMSAEGRQICPVKADVYVCPTSPVGDTDTYDCLPPDPFAGSGIGSSATDPWGSGVGDIYLPPNATAESNADIYDCLSDDTSVSEPDLITAYRSSQLYLDKNHSVILWPADKPLPDDYHPDDPFKSSTYIDDVTGEPLNRR